MSLYEIEIKSLLGKKENADALRQKLVLKGATLSAKNNQLNHYFVVNDISKFKENLAPHINAENKELFEKILREGSNLSIRTRDADGVVKLVVKASIGNDTSSNGVSRMEFEENVNMTISELDKLLLDSGLDYQAKWSREREEYKIGDMNICLDKNAGYGYLAEFEKVVEERGVADTIKSDLLKTMEDFGVYELPQDRLERMFSFYNNNWRDYYGTDRVFNIE